MNEPQDPLIANAEISEEILTFLTSDPKQKWGYKNEFEETYEEALEIVNSQQNKKQ